MEVLQLEFSDIGLVFEVFNIPGYEVCIGTC